MYQAGATRQAVATAWPSPPMRKRPGAHPFRWRPRAGAGELPAHGSQAPPRPRLGWQLPPRSGRSASPPFPPSPQHACGSGPVGPLARATPGFRRRVRAGGGGSSGCAHDGRRQRRRKPGQHANQAADVVNTLHVDSTPSRRSACSRRRAPVDTLSVSRSQPRPRNRRSVISPLRGMIRFLLRLTPLDRRSPGELVYQAADGWL
jgi:hypothetical protein